jgi:predicted MFS family arabinose efflux permease
MSTAAHLEPATGISLAAYARLVRSNRNFRRLWVAQMVSELGDWFYTLAIYTLLLQLTGRAGAVGLALMLQVLPQTLIGPAAGVISDRLRRQHVMIFADLARMVIVACMLFVRSAGTVWLVYPLLLLETIMAAFFEPARSAVIPNITRREDLVLANTLSSTTWSVGLVAGAALGGLAGALFGRDTVFVINSLSFLASAWLIRGMKFKEPHAEGRGPLQLRELADFSPVMDGLRYLRRNRHVAVTVMAKAGMFVIGPSWVVFTVLGERDFPVRLAGLDPHRGALLGMSLLMGARGVGALLGPLLSASWAGHNQRRLRMAIQVGFFLEVIGYGALRWVGALWSACLWIVLAHCGGSVIWVFTTTLLQLNTDDQFRGRVFAADLGLSTLTIAVGAYLAGFFMDVGISAHAVASSAGLLMLLPAFLWAWDSRQNSHSATGAPS